jgi:hypothetical protein
MKGSAISTWPECDLERGKRVRREVQRQCRAGTGETRNGETGEDQDEEAGARAGDEDQEGDRDERPGNRRERQGEGKRIDEAERDDGHRPEGRRGRCAEERWGSKRIAEQALQRCPGQAERRADHQRQQGPRQADLADDDRRRLAAGSGQPPQHLLGREQDRPHGQRCQEEARHQEEKAGKQGRVPSPLPGPRHRFPR